VAVEREAESRLVIVADDYGYAPAYDAGIVEAASAGAIDAVSVMVVRRPDPTALVETGVDLGLHLELPVEPARAVSAAVDEQLARFVAMFGQSPTHLDGHHHCHARGGEAALAVARTARRIGVAVRSVTARHRTLLRRFGVVTADRLVGRTSETAPEQPAEICAWLDEGKAPAGVTEWMVHPGHGGGGSSYDGGRERDLALLLELGDRSRWLGRGVRRAGPSEL
jgi:predicted glycoside hydrolase/deacetylase ChbG (UPF0249 family)